MKSPALHRTSSQYKTTTGAGYCRPKGRFKFHGDVERRLEHRKLARIVTFMPERLWGRRVLITETHIRPSNVVGWFLADFPWMKGKALEFTVNKNGAITTTSFNKEVVYWLWMNRKIHPSPALAQATLRELTSSAREVWLPPYDRGVRKRKK